MIVDPLDPPATQFRGATVGVWLLQFIDALLDDLEGYRGARGDRVGRHVDHPLGITQDDELLKGHKRLPPAVERAVIHRGEEFSKAAAHVLGPELFAVVIVVHPAIFGHETPPSHLGSANPDRPGGPTGDS